MFRKAVEIAVAAHKGQKDKSGVDYICHPLTVALKCETPEQKVVAVLHDVVEDTSVTLEELRMLCVFPNRVIEALSLLDHDKATPYHTYIQKIIDSGNILAIYVKMKDIEDNIDPSRHRMDIGREAQQEQLEKYNIAYHNLYSSYERLIKK